MRKLTAMRALFILFITMPSISVVLAQDPPEMWDPATFGDAFALEMIIDGLREPVGIIDPGDGSGRFFIVEQSGAILVLEDGVLREEPFLDLGDEISRGNEQGLLGLAFHPAFAENGSFFVSYTDQDGDTVIARYPVSGDDPNRADSGDGETILTVEQPFRNHNGGQILFGPDGYLYIGLGDGGSGGDPEEHGQNRNTLLGGILRIDVDQSDGDRPYAIPPDNPFADGIEGAPEVFIYGLRNPWRFAFDPATGDLFIADVGQNAIEEVTFLPAGSQAGANLGWNLLEGSACFRDRDCDPDGTVLPIAEYSHSFGCSVTGGVVVRESAIPALEGVYLYADYCSGLIWGIARDSGGEWQASEPVETGLNISAFGSGPAGEVFVVDHGGAIYRLTAAGGDGA